ncbi:hypothetical protein D9M73_65900 [compost metagenome]|nr:MAG TPA: hypothetical protein [Caudoviricetes sp.]
MSNLTASQTMEMMPSPREMAQRHRAFLESIAPLIQIKVGVMSLAMPTRLILSDGTVEKFDDGLWPAGRALIAEADRQIEETAKRMGLYEFIAHKTPEKQELA